MLIFLLFLAQRMTLLTIFHASYDIHKYKFCQSRQYFFPVVRNQMFYL